jgi:Nif-specific regulatory protein
MTPGAKAYLVVQRPDGLGNVFALHAGKRYTMGRAKTAEIVLNDDLCSRQHAEVYYADGSWRLHDCGSMNGTRINNERVEDDWELEPGDEVGLGRSKLLFVQTLAQLPPLGAQSAVHGVAIKKRQRLGQTRYDTLAPEWTTEGATPIPVDRHRISRDLSLLYHLALNMGSAATEDALIEVLLRGLLEATQASTAAVLAVKDQGQIKVLAYECRGEREAYAKLPTSLKDEVLATREGILAEEENRLQERDPDDDEIEVFSQICAPVLDGERVEALLHIYCTDPHRVLTTDDLELTVTVGKQFAVARQSLKREEALREENERLRAQVASEIATEIQLVGKSPAMQEIEAQVGRVAPTNAIVLIRGESGVGKELVARAIHLASPRRREPFICLNCAALAESLLESELFGHEKGAFTGATDRKIGKFESAHKGTIFLDEIGEMNPSAQAKLLRILEGHPYERVGGAEPIQVNVRVVAATNRPLEEAVNAGQFRKDLYFRLQVVEIRVPGLRERPTDIPLLAEHFFQRFTRETGRRIRGFTAKAIDKMLGYHWPGNVRELRNVVERAVALGNGPMLDAADIWLSSLEALQHTPVAPAPSYQPMSIDEVEKRHIALTLTHTEWNKSRAAEILGIERSTLDRKIKAYELKR